MYMYIYTRGHMAQKSVTLASVLQKQENRKNGTGEEL